MVSGLYTNKSSSSYSLSVHTQKRVQSCILSFRRWLEETNSYLKRVCKKNTSEKKKRKRLNFKETTIIMKTPKILSLLQYK